MPLNFHTHHPRPGERYVRSLGLHPWHLRAETLAADMEELRQRLSQEGNRYEMVGECGLDKACHTPLPLQAEAFTQQLLLAEEVGKPVVVHCVRAFNELHALRTRHHWQQPWVVHGYAGALPLTQQLRRAGIQFSFGRNLHLPKTQGSLAFLATGLAQGESAADFFLETDDDEGKTIEEVYDQAATILRLPRQRLEEAIEANYQRLLGSQANH